MAAFVHHQDIWANADHSADVTLELSIWHPSGSSKHYVRIVRFSVDSHSLRFLVLTAFFYSLSSFIFCATIQVLIAVQLHFNGVG